MSERAAVERLRRLLQSRRLLFLEVGEPYRGVPDRVISTMDERNGATVSNREYNALLRAIVKAAR